MTNAYATEANIDASAQDSDVEDKQAQSASEPRPSISKAKKSATAFRTISEVADELDVQQHVLRFWETKFTQVRPLKRGGGRRYYRPEDIEILKHIRHLLYTEGYTIKGVQKLLKGQGKAQILASAPKPEKVMQTRPAAYGQPNHNGKEKGLSDTQRALLQDMLTDLRNLRTIIIGD